MKVEYGLDRPADHGRTLSWHCSHRTDRQPDAAGHAVFGLRIEENVRPDAAGHLSNTL